MKAKILHLRWFRHAGLRDPFLCVRLVAVLLCNLLGLGLGSSHKERNKIAQEVITVNDLNPNVYVYI